VHFIDKFLVTVKFHSGYFGYFLGHEAPPEAKWQTWAATKMCYIQDLNMGPKMRAINSLQQGFSLIFETGEE
jgi:hypothetical protein